MSLFELHLGAAHRAALDHGKPFVYACPPAGWAIVRLFAHLGLGPSEPDTSAVGVTTLVLTPGLADALELESALDDQPRHHPRHCVSGLARAERLLRSGDIRTLLTTPHDALELIRRAALKPAEVRHLVVVRPEEMLAAGAEDTADTVLAEASTAQRVMVTAEPKGLTTFLERHARRAPVLDWRDLPEEPLGPARYALWAGSSAATCRAALDVLNPKSSVIWSPIVDPSLRRLAEMPGVELTDLMDDRADGPSMPLDVAICAELPSTAVLRILRERAREVLVLVRSSQLEFLQRIVQPLKPVRLPSEVDRARTQAFALRAHLRTRLEEGGLGTELLALEPLLQDFDPVLVAAAAIAGRGQPVATPEAATWTHLRVSAGRRDNVRAGDLMGLLLNAIGLRREDVGRIDVRESFALVEVRPEDAERVIREMGGRTLRGRRVTARLDRR